MPQQHKDDVADGADFNAFKFTQIVECNLVEVRGKGVMSVSFELIEGAIKIKDAAKLDRLENLVGKRVCLSRNESRDVPMKIYVIGTLHRMQHAPQGTFKIVR